MQASQAEAETRRRNKRWRFGGQSGREGAAPVDHFWKPRRLHPKF